MSRIYQHDMHTGFAFSKIIIRAPDAAWKAYILGCFFYLKSAPHTAPTVISPLFMNYQLFHRDNFQVKPLKRDSNI